MEKAPAPLSVAPLLAPGGHSSRRRSRCGHTGAAGRFEREVFPLRRSIGFNTGHVLGGHLSLLPPPS
eukprot:scaffold3134_cov414-Prasinococcus_capsulatus_cf.AAC.17